MEKIVTTPAIAAILAGLALFITGLRLPGPLVTAMEGLGSCMAPLSMLVIGILFSELDLKRVLCQGRIYWVAGLRLLVYPLLSMAVLLALRVLWPHSDGTTCCWSAFCAPLGRRPPPSLRWPSSTTTPTVGMSLPSMCSPPCCAR